MLGAKDMTLWNGLNLDARWRQFTLSYHCNKTVSPWLASVNKPIELAGNTLCVAAWKLVFKKHYNPEQ